MIITDITVALLIVVVIVIALLWSKTHRVIVTAIVCMMLVCVVFIGSFIARVWIDMNAWGMPFPDEYSSCLYQQRQVLDAARQWAEKHDNKLPDKAHWQAAVHEIEPDLWLQCYPIGPKAEPPKRARPFDWLLTSPLPLDEAAKSNKTTVIQCRSHRRLTTTFADGHQESSPNPEYEQWSKRWGGMLRSSSHGVYVYPQEKPST
jgi:hypothetical protein